jgi:uncharacterized Zn finger protein
MPRENARSKAGRLLTEGRIEIVRLDEHGCLALVRGDSGEIRTVRFERGGWTCDCPALSCCSHAMACALVPRDSRPEDSRRPPPSPDS